jgi:hypothetical protein
MRVSVLLAGISFAASCAAQGSTCQPGCAEDKRECRAFAQHEAKKENSPLATMNEALPHIRYSGDARGRSIDDRAAERRDFDKRRMERTSACEDKYQKCVRTCEAAASSDADAPSVVRKPKGEL